MYKFFLSLRYFRSRFLALAALLAITFGVAMLLIVLSVMGGYMEQLRENIRGQEAHIQLLGPGPLGIEDLLGLEETLAEVENVTASAPFISRSGMYQSGVSVRPVRIEGVDPVRQARVSDFGRYVLRPDELESLLARHIPAAPETETAAVREVDVPAAVQDVHEVIHSPEREPLRDAELDRFFSLEFRRKILETYRRPLVAEFPVPPPGVIAGIHMLLERQVTLGQVLTAVTLSPDTGEEIKERFLVVGAAKSGEFEVDSSVLYTDVEVLRNMLNRSIRPGQNAFRYQGVRVLLEDPSRLEETRDAIAARLESEGTLLQVATWKDLRHNMLKAVSIEKYIVYFLVLILVAFTGSMVLLMLLLTVIEKTRDVGILTSLGATPNGVASIFLINGLLISILGTCLGLALGYAFSRNINAIHDVIYAVTGRQLFPPEIYKMDRIPIAFEPIDILLSTIPPVLIGLLASLIPAVWAPRRDPIRVFQYE